MYNSEIDPLVLNPAAIEWTMPRVAYKKTTIIALLAATLVKHTSVSNRPNWITSTNGFKERIKGLEKTLQLHPGRSDIRLEIMEIRKQIREIEAENKKARKKASPTNRKNK